MSALAVVPVEPSDVDARLERAQLALVESQAITAMLARRVEALQAERDRHAPRRRRRPVTEECVRDAARRLGTFSPGALAAELGVSVPALRPRLKALADRGVVVVSGTTRDRRYRYSRPSGPGEAFKAQQRLRRVTPDLSLAAVGPRGRDATPIAGTGRQDKVTDQDMADLKRQAEAQGWHFKATSHGWLGKRPDAPRPLMIPSTPSDVRARRNKIAQMRRLGIVVS